MNDFSKFKVIAFSPLDNASKLKSTITHHLKFVGD